MQRSLPQGGRDSIQSDLLPFFTEGEFYSVSLDWQDPFIEGLGVTHDLPYRALPNAVFIRMRLYSNLTHPQHHLIFRSSRFQRLLSFVQGTDGGNQGF